MIRIIKNAELDNDRNANTTREFVKIICYNVKI